MSALLKSIAILLILAVATMAVFAVFDLMSWAQLMDHAGRIALVAGIVAAASFAISWMLRSR